MSRKRSRDGTHEAWVERLERRCGYDDLIRFIEDNKPRRPVEDNPDQWKAFQRALYVVLMTAKNIRKEDGWEWEQIRCLIRSAAVAIVELE